MRHDRFGAALVTRTWCVGAVVALAATAPTPTARAERLSLEVGGGAGAFSNAGAPVQYGVAMSVGVGLATSRRLAFDLRYVRVQDLGSTRSTERFQFIGPGLHVFVSERVFLGFGLGLAGASGPGPAIDGRVGAALVPIGRGYLFGSLEACAAAAIDGDSDSARAAVLLFGYRAR